MPVRARCDSASMPAVQTVSVDSAVPALRDLAREHAGLRVLVLHGSRARGEARADSDWDFAYLATPGTDLSLLYSDLALALQTDAIDLTDLATAGGLLRYRAARDGVVVFERELRLFSRFWFDAVSFWCDAAPVLRQGYKSVLEGLGR
jgi:predicted nucleotidyltransferase